MIKKIPYTKPSITELEYKYASDAVINGWGDNCYDYINKFEKEFARYLGVKFAISTSSCTGALHLGLAALGIGSGDEVIMADTNWIATVSPIVHLGAKPVYVDVLKDSWCIDPQCAEKAITSNTKAIIATHLYGNLCEMDKLLEIGRKHNIPVLEDSAEAIGSIFNGERAGSMGLLGVFSFHGTKTMTTGEGGMLVTNDGALYEQILTLSNHGRSKTQQKQFWPDVVGYKFKMSNVQAAIGLAQLERVEKLVQRKREILSKYKHAFRDYSNIQFNPEPKNIINGAWMPTIVFQDQGSKIRDTLIKQFKTENIDARVFFWPLSSLPMFESLENININAYNLPTRSLNLPSFHDISDLEINLVVNVIKNNLKGKT